MNLHTVRRDHRRRDLLAVLVVLLALLAGALHAAGASAAIVENPEPGLIARWEPCEPDTGVTVIVDEQKLAAGKIYVGCAPGEPTSGAEALEKAGFQIEGTGEYGLGFICRIEGEPSVAEQACLETPGANAYWSYWHGKPGGRWSFSGVGAENYKPRLGSVEGWSFGGGKAPRIEPMDGSGRSTFTLPPEQESSVIPAALAREWLSGVTLENVSMIDEGAEIGTEPVASGWSALERLLAQARVLIQAGVQPAKLAPLAALLAANCEERKVVIEGCELRHLDNPLETLYAARVAAAVLGLQALGQNTESFAGLDPRGTLEGMIEEETGEVQGSETVEALAPTVLALARGGTLSAKARESVELLIAQQTPTGQFGAFGAQTETSVDVEAIQALVAAREQGEGVLGKGLLEQIEVALPKAGKYLESIQAPDGGVPRREEGGPVFSPDVESTAQGAVGLALAGDHEAAEQAAKWVSQYQVTAEYAGHGNTETGEHTPAEALIGAFLPSEGALKQVLAYGESVSVNGPAAEGQQATGPALLALMTAGPYGPYDAAFDQESLFFERRPVGSPSKLTATLTNEDVRPVTITTVGLGGEEPADFSVGGGNCAGRTLTPGETCEVQVSFDPTTPGLHSALLQALLAGTSQTIDLAVTGTGVATAAQKETPTGQTGTESPAVGGQRTGALRVQAPRLDGKGASRGLVGVSWRVSEAGSGVKWTIAARALGVEGARYVTAAAGTGTAVTSALLKLSPGRVYELRFTFTDAQGHRTTAQIGKVVVPEGERRRGLHYGGHWRRIKQAGAWLDAVARGVEGARVSVRLTAGRPVFVLRATSTAAKVEVRCDGQRQVFAVAKGSAGVSRQITAAERPKAGTVTLLVLKGTVDLDGVADEG